MTLDQDRTFCISYMLNNALFVSNHYFKVAYAVSVLTPHIRDRYLETIPNLNTIMD